MSTTSSTSSTSDLCVRVERWRTDTLEPSVKRMGVQPHEVTAEPNSPLGLEDFDFLRDVGLPGEYPFTSWLYPTPAQVLGGETMHRHRAGRYSGFGASVDCRDYYRSMRDQGMRIGGANIASDLPSQLGWDSDDPRAAGEVGQVGVAIDSLRDFEIIYESFTGDHGLDKVASNWTINAPASVYIAFYCALAAKRGVSTQALRCTPQNDILKEFVARGLYIFPVRESLRLVRDTIVFMDEYMPRANSISICAEHMRYAGASTEQSLAFGFCNAREYVQLGIEAGLDVDRFVQRFTFRGFGDSSLAFLPGVAAPRAARRIWARIMREEFGAKLDRTCLLRGGEHAWGNAYTKMTAHRYINNIVRATIEAMIQATASGEVTGGLSPFDEPLGLGHSIEAQQVSRDIKRIIFHEAKLGRTLDPLGGSYAVEKLTREIEERTLAEMETVAKGGGAIWGVESGHYRAAIAQSAWEHQSELENGQEVWVGVNGYTSDQEIDVEVNRTPEYDPALLATAEERQKAELMALRRERDDRLVAATLTALKQAARDPGANLIPPMIECALAYATIGQICHVLREQFGEAMYS
ncbi:methylmalonyl-CoA mutase family protein [Conexibacter sp. DBS9H8]|uniref:methylmalonyl-CoA mutase family protein n=1 Tax=Conexibacter sp. DBS9H8 TaxID=2937801 RepID=UPI00200FA37C|nr:methylmalonyl-CoA mutase family protein [Conexibacter sp. DBS9H8]